MGESALKGYNSLKWQVTHVLKSFYLLILQPD